MLFPDVAVDQPVCVFREFNSSHPLPGKIVAFTPTQITVAFEDAQSVLSSSKLERFMRTNGRQIGHGGYRAQPWSPALQEAERRNALSSQLADLSGRIKRAMSSPSMLAAAGDVSVFAELKLLAARIEEIGNP